MISKLSIKILLIFIITCAINAQQINSIIVDYSFWGNDFFIDGHEYSKSEIRDTLKKYKITEELIRLSKSDKIWGYVSLSAGIFLSGYSTYHIEKSYSERSESPYWILPAFTALALDITGIVLLINSKNKFYEAINIYNHHLPTKDHSSKYKLDLKFDINKVTLSLKF